MTDFPLQSDLSLARELADMADAISMDRFRAADLVVTTKPDMSPVSDADKAVENALRWALLDSRPGDSILGEEFGVDGKSTRQWLIDPIDGAQLARALETAAAMPSPNPAAREAAALHDVRRQAERVEEILLRAVRDPRA